jgi:hypothetical protein
MSSNGDQDDAGQADQSPDAGQTAQTDPSQNQPSVPEQTTGATSTQHDGHSVGRQLGALEPPHGPGDTCQFIMNSGWGGWRIDGTFRCEWSESANEYRWHCLSGRSWINGAWADGGGDSWGAW